MNTSAYSHDNEFDLFQKNTHAELQTWIKVLEALHQELDAFTKWMSYANTTDSALLQKVNDKRNETRSQLSIYYKYVNQVQDNRECDDMDCEIYYQRQHEQLRRLFNYHIEQCSKLKCNVFNTLNVVNVSLKPSGNIQSGLK